MKVKEMSMEGLAESNRLLRMALNDQIERTSQTEARVKELEAQVERLMRPVTDEELLKLNEKFGYFEFRDAQGGKSREFVNDLMSTIAARDAEKEKPPQS